MELLGQPVRVTEIDPGMVQTDFSLIRFDGDEDRAQAVYRGVTPLTADDIADMAGPARVRNFGRQNRARNSGYFTTYEAATPARRRAAPGSRCPAPPPP